MSDDVVPSRLELAEDDRLCIVWSDGHKRLYTPGELRRNCPCATCREQRDAPPPPATSLPVLSPAEAQPLALRAMKPVGHYAYSITFSDGHSTGIYTFELLRALGEPAA